MSGYLALFLSTLLLIAALYVFRANRNSRLLGGFVSAVFFVLLGLSGVYLIADYFTGAGITESVIYHLRYGLRGSGFGEYLGLLIAVPLFVALAVSAATWVFRQLSGGHVSRFAFKAAALALLMTAVAVNPVNRKLLALYAVAESAAEAGPPAFAMIYPSTASTGPRRNLVYLYLESLERTYLDESLFPGLAPNLQALEREARSFTDVRQLHGTGWTIGGMVASQCGLPLFLPPDEEAGDAAEDFLPGARCMGDVLRQAGYRLDFLGGASLAFAGKGAFYRSHGFSGVEGREELTGRLADPDYQSGWGIHDDSLFGFAALRYQGLAASGQPFGLFLLTLDTHRNGHESAWCEDVHYGEGEDAILNAVHCTDRQVGAFVDAIRHGPGGDDTLIVIASDHLAMRNESWDRLQRGTRRNLLLVLDPAGTAAWDNRPASTLDAAPTILSLMGLKTAALGLGRDLGAPAPTLVEAMPDANGFLERQRSFVLPLWTPPVKEI